MAKFYYTFGSASQFPYHNTYLVVIADSEKEADEKFRKKYPDRHEGILNCAFVYPENRWEGSLNQISYPSEPAEIIQ